MKLTQFYFWYEVLEAPGHQVTLPTTVVPVVGDSQGRKQKLETGMHSLHLSPSP